MKILKLDKIGFLFLLFVLIPIMLPLQAKADGITISNLEISQVGPNSAVVTWQTNVGADSQARIALDTSTLQGMTYTVYEDYSADRTSHQVAFSGLQNNYAYHFNVRSTAVNAAPDEEFNIFITNSTNADEVRAENVMVTPSQTSAVISWTNNVLAANTVFYSTSPDNLQNSSLYSHAFMLNGQLDRSVTLYNLQPNTHYYFLIRPDNQYVGPSVNYTGDFTTLVSVGDQVIISNLQVEVTSIQSAVISWTTNLPADTQGRVSSNPDDIDNMDFGIYEPYASDRYNHRVVAFGLDPGTTYYYKVRSAASNTNVSAESRGSFITWSEGVGVDADLEPVAVSWSNDGLNNWNSKRLTLTVRNNGPMSTHDSFQVSISDLDGSNYVDYYYFNYPSTGGTIAPGGQVSAVIHYSAGSPDFYPNLRIRVNSNNDIAETNYDNNYIDYHYSGGQGNQITISNVVVTNLNPTRVRVTWTASYESDGQLRYSANQQEVDQIDLQHALIDWYSPGEVNHSITITGLHPHTTYYFRLDSTNGNYGEAVPYHGNFTTLPNLPNQGDEDNSNLTERERQLIDKINRLQIRISELERALAEKEKALVAKVDSQLTERLKGKILLQVEEKGEAWYVDKDSGKKYYLKDGSSAFNLLNLFGLGIKNQDLNKIQTAVDTSIVVQDSDNDQLDDKLEEAIGTDPTKADSDGDGYNDNEEINNGYNPIGADKLSIDNSLTNRLEGKIMLQVEDRGQAWYIHDGKKYYLKDGEMAYQIMRQKSLGITNENLRKIDVGQLE